MCMVLTKLAGLDEIFIIIILFIFFLSDAKYWSGFKYNTNNIFFEIFVLFYTDFKFPH